MLFLATPQIDKCPFLSPLPQHRTTAAFMAGPRDECPLPSSTFLPQSTFDHGADPSCCRLFRRFKAPLACLVSQALGAPLASFSKSSFPSFSFINSRTTTERILWSRWEQR